MSPQTNQEKTTHYLDLKRKWVQRHQNLQESFWHNHGHHIDKVRHVPRQLAAGSLAGLIMMSQPLATPAEQTQEPEVKVEKNAVESSSKNSIVTTQSRVPLIHEPNPVPTPTDTSPQERKDAFMSTLSEQLPASVQPLSNDQKSTIATTLSKHYNLPVTHELEGKQLNRSYGLIGAEQHLMRYSGDTMATHFQTQAEAQHYSSGMAPGRGAWGYFANSRSELTQKDIDREKYYIAVQTFLSPGWNNDVRGHYQFFKYRKMLVVNPENGKAVVACIGDAGPAKFTGKSLGGSPEVMNHLERVDGAQKGPVLYYFIDDPSDQVPLGPIDIS